MPKGLQSRLTSCTSSLQRPKWLAQAAHSQAEVVRNCFCQAKCLRCNTSRPDVYEVVNVQCQPLLTVSPTMLSQLSHYTYTCLLSSLISQQLYPPGQQLQLYIATLNDVRHSCGPPRTSQRGKTRLVPHTCSICWNVLSSLSLFLTLSSSLSLSSFSLPSASSSLVLLLSLLLL